MENVFKLSIPRSLFSIAFVFLGIMTMSAQTPSLTVTMGDKTYTRSGESECILLEFAPDNNGMYFVESIEKMEREDKKIAISFGAELKPGVYDLKKLVKGQGMLSFGVYYEDESVRYISATNDDGNITIKSYDGSIVVGTFEYTDIAEDGTETPVKGEFVVKKMKLE